MSDLTNFLDDIRAWTGRKDFPDPLVQSFVKMAETTLVLSLRVREMLVTADAVCTENKVALPYDWAEGDLVRFTNGKPLRYITNDDFYDVDPIYRDPRTYTIAGNDIEFGAPIDQTEGLEVTMRYFQHIPPFTDAKTWLYDKYYVIFLQSCNAAAALYAQEVDRASQIEGTVSGMIQAANAMYRRGEISGSVLRRNTGKRIG